MAQEDFISAQRALLIFKSVDNRNRRRPCWEQYLERASSRREYFVVESGDLVDSVAGSASHIWGEYGGPVSNQRGGEESPSSKQLQRRVRAVIADDFAEVLDAVERRLKSECEIVGRASDGLALVERICQLQPDIFVTDISMPGLTGIEALHRLRSMGINTPAVILSVHEDEELAKEALSQGASGYVLKSRIDDDLLIAVREALAGRTFISERLRRKLPDSK